MILNSIGGITILLKQRSQNNNQLINLTYTEFQNIIPSYVTPGGFLQGIKLLI